MKKLYTAKNDLIFKTIMLEQPELLKKRVRKGYILEQGIEQGSKNKSVEIAKNLLKTTQMSLKEISLSTGLSIEEFEKLKAQD